MTPQNTLGWVLDQDTSQRRLCLYQVSPTSIGLLVEVYGQPSIAVALDAEGLAALQTLVGLALARCRQEES